MVQAGKIKQRIKANENVVVASLCCLHHAVSFSCPYSVSFLSFFSISQSDVYSFGILLLEMLTRKRPTDEKFTDGINLHKYVKIALPNKLLQIVDPALLHRELKQKASPAEEEENRNDQLSEIHMEKCLLELFHIGLVCSAESPRERMNMRDVTKELNLIKSSFLAGRRIETGAISVTVRINQA